MNPDAARKAAAECMALAAKEAAGERSAVLMAMARSWMTLANQMARLEATTIARKARRRSTRPG
jgi:hypothetical protein